MACYCRDRLSFILSLFFFIYVIMTATLVRPGEGNFTIVIIVLVRSTTYADQRITGPAMDIAVQKIRDKYPALGDFKVITWDDDFLSTCDGLEANVVSKAAGLYFAKLDTKHPISAFIGTTCTFGNLRFLDPLYYWNIPLLEGSSIPSFIADRNRYPMIVGYSYTQRRAGEFFYQVVKMFGWTDVAALYDVNDPVWRAMYTAMDYLKEKREEKDEKKLIRFEEVTLRLANRKAAEISADIERAVKQAHKTARIFLILANPRTIREIVVRAHILGYGSGDHVFIAGDYFKTKNYFGLPDWAQGTVAEQQQAREAFRSLFLVKQRVPVTPEFEEFSSLVQEGAIRKFNQSIPPYDEVNTHAIGFHDAIYSYGEVLNEAIQEGQNIFDGRSMIKRFTNRTFSGIRGNFTLDSDNNLKGQFELWNFHNRSGEFVKVVDFPETAVKAEIVSEIEWASGQSYPPPNTPFCWFLDNNPACRDHTLEYVIGAVVVGLACTGFLAFLAVIYSERRRHRKLEQTDLKWWDVQAEEVSMVEKTPADDSTPVTSVYRLETISLLPISASIITEEALIQLKKLRSIHYEKILRILGLCLDRNVMLTEYCARGSLYNFVRSGTGDGSLLHGWIFRFSIMSDLIEGLNFLHHSWFHHHGRLKSTSCYLTFRFVLKIGDYCLQSLTPAQTLDLKNSIWSAPEILRGNSSVFSVSGQKAADIYSLAVIFSEVCLFGDPFLRSGFDSDTADTVKLIREIRQPPFRPNLSFIEGLIKPLHVDLQALIEDCWQDAPAKRPTAITVHRKLEKLIGKRKDGLVEEILARAAGHAEELEDLVAERSHELHNEKHKIQELLFQILPKSVALDLINGNVMVPEEYESVTVLFSAVQDFAATAATCTPTQLMLMMHTLYTAIDGGIGRFDVYKVETVIDQYLIASGVPVRNGTAHVAEIAACALYLRHAATLINWPRHDSEGEDDSPLAIKFLIGFHTGRIMTGVIGTKMPRFCLFGDTINTASRMESTAEGGQIQFSEASKTLLEQTSGFAYVPRGEIAVKGKGMMRTYFLLDPIHSHQSLNDPPVDPLYSPIAPRPATPHRVRHLKRHDTLQRQSSVQSRLSPSPLASQGFKF